MSLGFCSSNFVCNRFLGSGFFCIAVGFGGSFLSGSSGFPLSLAGGDGDGGGGTADGSQCEDKGEFCHHESYVFDYCVSIGAQKLHFQLKLR